MSNKNRKRNAPVMPSPESRPPSGDERDDDLDSEESAVATAMATAIGPIDPGLLHGPLDNEGPEDVKDAGGDDPDDGSEGAEPADVVEDPVRTAIIDVPICPSSGYATRNLRDLPRRHADILRDVIAALVRDAATVDGLPVRDGTDAVAWILERVAADLKPQ